MSVCDGKRGNKLQIESNLEGTLIAGPCIDLCLPVDKATIFMKGTLRQTNLSSKGLRLLSSGGTQANSNPFAFACTGSTPFVSCRCKVLSLEQAILDFYVYIHCIPSEHTYSIE